MLVISVTRRRPASSQVCMLACLSTVWNMVSVITALQFDSQKKVSRHSMCRSVCLQMWQMKRGELLSLWSRPTAGR